VAERAIGEGGLFPCCRAAIPIKVPKLILGGILEDGKTKFAEHGEIARGVGYDELRVKILKSKERGEMTEGKRRRNWGWALRLRTPAKTLKVGPRPRPQLSTLECFAKNLHHHYSQ
jgi:hypothetical protein